jgi:hypothetical protein
MIQQGKALDDRVGRWRILLGNVQEILDSVPYIVDDVDELQQIDNQVRDLRVEIASLQARLQGATRTLRLLADRGDRVRARLGASLRGRYGFTSESLLRFGLKPRPRSRRAAALQDAEDREKVLVIPSEEE